MKDSHLTSIGVPVSGPGITTLRQRPQLPANDGANDLGTYLYSKATRKSHLGLCVEPPRQGL